MNTCPRTPALLLGRWIFVAGKSVGPHILMLWAKSSFRKLLWQHKIFTAIQNFCLVLRFQKSKQYLLLTSCAFQMVKKIWALAVGGLVGWLVGGIILKPASSLSPPSVPSPPLLCSSSSCSTLCTLWTLCTRCTICTRCTLDNLYNLHTAHCTLCTLCTLHKHCSLHTSNYTGLHSVCSTPTCLVFSV